MRNVGYMESKYFKAFFKRLLLYLIWRNPMNDKNKIKNTYTKDMLINEISSKCGKSKRLVKEIYDAIEDKVFEVLSSANEDEDVSVRLFEGVVIDATYIPEHEKINNLTGESIIAKSKIKPRVKITRSYCEKVSSGIK